MKTRRFARRLLVMGIDALILPAVGLAAILLKAVRRTGLHRLVLCRRMLLRLGVLPVRRHYYEPFSHPNDLRQSLDRERRLTGINWNVGGQLQLLDRLRFEQELSDLDGAPKRGDFRLNNGSFESGDAEYLYQITRLMKPRRVFEIGSGQSTLIARRALRRNEEECPGYRCEHVCIEPFEAPWLEEMGVTTRRSRVEDLDIQLFSQLESGDLLFIDSSHVIRPQGDVVTEYLEILPMLKAGTIVHIHDIFSPRDYLHEWVNERLWLWNEQYLLEAFLTHNESWEVIGALNFLHHHHFDELKRVCPYLNRAREPGSFYIRKLR